MANIITAHIGSTSIKVCEISHSAKATVIHRAFKLKTPEGVIEDGKILDMERLSAFMNAEFTKHAITAKEITFILSSSKIAVKEVYTPVLKAAKLKEMIKVNASDYFPVDIEDYIITEKIISQAVMESGEKQLRVNVLAAPKDMVEAYYDLAEKLGLAVKNIEHHSNATVSLLKKQIGEETSVVIHVHDDSTTVNVFRSNILELQRTVPYGKNVVIQALMEERGMDEDEAEALCLKERMIHKSFDGDEVTEALRYLINSIVRVVDYYTSRNSDSPVEKAYLTGESVNMLGLEELFANEFDFSVIQLMSFEGVAIGPDLILEPRYVSLFISCTGAVLEPVNFEPEKTTGAGRKDKSMQYLLIGAAASLVLGAALVAVPAIQNMSVKSDIEDMSEKIEAIKAVEIVVDEYYDSKDILDDVKGFVDISSNANDYLLDFLYALEKGQPSDVSIRSMSVQSGYVSITATTSTKQTIAKLITQLKGMPGVTGVYVASTTESKDEYGVVTSAFSIVCRFGSKIEQYLIPEPEETENPKEGEVE